MIEIFQKKKLWLKPTSKQRKRRSNKSANPGINNKHSHFSFSHVHEKNVKFIKNIDSYLSCDNHTSSLIF